MKLLREYIREILKEAPETSSIETVGDLKKLLENHINNQGMAAIEKLGEEALNVSPERSR